MSKVRARSRWRLLTICLAVAATWGLTATAPARAELPGETADFPRDAEVHPPLTLGGAGPTNGGTIRTLTPALSIAAPQLPDVAWVPAVYTFYVARDPGLTDIVHQADTLSNVYRVPPGILSDGATYYWAVDAEWEYDWWESPVFSVSLDVVPPVSGHPVGWLGRNELTANVSLFHSPRLEPGVMPTYRIQFYSSDPGSNPPFPTVCGTDCFERGALAPSASKTYPHPGPNAAAIYWWRAWAYLPGAEARAKATPVRRIVVNPTFAYRPDFIEPRGVVERRNETNLWLPVRVGLPDPDLLNTCSTQCRLMVGIGAAADQLVPSTDSGDFDDTYFTGDYSYIFPFGPLAAKGTLNPATYPSGSLFNGPWVGGASFPNGGTYFWNAVGQGYTISGGGLRQQWRTADTSYYPQFTIRFVDDPLCPIGGAVQSLTPTLSVGWQCGTLAPDTTADWRRYRIAVYDSPDSAEPAIWTSTLRAPVAGATQPFAVPPGVLENGRSYWFATQTEVGHFNGGGGLLGDWSFRVGFTVEVPPTVPLLATPPASATLSTLTPTLAAASSPSARRAPISMEFRVASDSTCLTTVGTTSGWTRDSTYVVPEGLLRDGATYWWQARAKNKFATTGWSACRSFTTRLSYLGRRGDWAMWNGGPVGVHLKTGNLTMDLPGPSYPTLIGTMGMSLSYNSQAGTDQGFGPGIAVGLPAGADGGAAPVKLIDQNLPDGRAGGPAARPDRSDAIDILGSDGISERFYPTGDGYTYVPEERAGTTLRRISEKAENDQPDTSPPAWTLTRGDGAIYTFGYANPETGEAPLLSAQSSSTARGQAKLVYEKDGLGRVTSIHDDSNRALALDWGGTARCDDAIVCVSLRSWDPLAKTTGNLFPGEPLVWRYVGATATPTQAPLRTVKWSDGATTRRMLGIEWANGRIIEVKDANSLANESAPTPLHNGAYSLKVGYDAATPAKVSYVEQGPVTAQVGDPNARTTFAYNTGGTTDPTRADHAPHIGLGQTRTAEGSTTITPPRGGTSTIWYDNIAHPIQSRDPLGRTSQTGWSNDLQVWSEDPTGAPSDTTYDPLFKVPTRAKGPAVDVVGQPAPVRPETLNYYDERRPRADASSAAGPALEGLRAEYFDNRNLAGRPVATTTDPQVDFDWGPGAPGPLQAPIPVEDDFSVRWSGTFEVAAGEYLFSTVADGGTRVAVDGVLLLSRWEDIDGAVTSTSESATLSAGRHRVEVSYFDGSDASPAASVRLLHRLASEAATLDRPLAAADLRPAYLNATSTVSPTGRRSFSHFPQPWTGLADYTLVRRMSRLM